MPSLPSLSGVVLPENTLWINEFDYTPIVQTVAWTIGRPMRRVTRTTRRSGGRPVTLRCEWMSKATLDALAALRDTPDIVMALLLPLNRALEVRWRYDGTPIAAAPIMEQTYYEPSDIFETVILQLTT
ncbi:MAG: hypothetical protein EPN21_13205 [Methylococcaceae bacterium]|nr:MAG: hypothetical protein EPN21_13205 [Methylococcaceae bacterium]